MKLETLSTDQLKKEYVRLCSAAMIYGTKTEVKRRKIAEEIKRREAKNKITTKRSDVSCQNERN